MKNNYQRCIRCILPNTLPVIEFDDQGVCNYCRDYEKSYHDWDKISEQKQNEFKNLLQAARKKRRAYDCLVP